MSNVLPSGGDPNRLVVQFQVIRGPDEMVGSSNQGGARLFFFALDSTGQLWRGVAEEGQGKEKSDAKGASGQPIWSRIVGPLDPV